MSGRLFISTAIAAAIVGSVAFAGSAQATVAAPGAATERAAQSLNFTEQVRRVCRTRLTCERFPCRFVQQCYVTKDYPPEHGRR
jgi:hypothetical protein